MAPEAVVIAGTGVNVHPASVPPDVEATCLAAWSAATVADARARLAAELGRAWPAIVAAGGLPESDRTLLEARMAPAEAPVEVVLPDGVVTGLIAGLAEDGGLRLRPLDGAGERVLHVGEIARGPRPASRTGPETAVYLPEHDDC